MTNKNHSRVDLKLRNTSRGWSITNHWEKSLRKDWESKQEGITHTQSEKLKESSARFFFFFFFLLHHTSPSKLLLLNLLMMLASLSWCTIQYQEWEFYKGRRDVGERTNNNETRWRRRRKGDEKGEKISSNLPATASIFHVFVLLLSVIFDIKKSFLSCLHCSDLWFFSAPSHRDATQTSFFFQIGINFQVFYFQH